MIQFLAMLFCLSFSIVAQANVFNPLEQTLPLSGKMYFAGENEPGNPPGEQETGWSDVSGNFNLNAPGWYWLKFDARSSSSSTPVIFPTNPSLRYTMLEKSGGSYADAEQSRIFRSANFWGDYRLVLEPNVSRSFYVKVKTSRIGYATGIDFSISTPEYILNKRLQTYLPWLVFVGIVLCLIIYNSYIYLQTRDRFYVFYIGTEIFLHLIHMPGLVFMWNWLFPESVNYFVVTGGGLLLGYLFIFMFLSLFARFDEVMSRRVKIIVYVASLSFIPYGISLVLAKPVGALLLGNIVSVLAMLGGVIYVAMKSRSRNAIILCFSFAPIPIAAAVYVVNRLLGNSNDVGSVYYLVSVLALEGVIMAIALADRIKQLEIRSREEESMRKSLEFELETAEVLQRVLLPEPLSLKGFVSQPYYRPARRNGGDWFTTHLDEASDTLFLAMVDVTGHGLTSAILASFVSGTVMGELHDTSSSLEPELRLGKIVEKVNQTLLATSDKSGLVATGLFLAVQRKSRKLAFINCAHPPMVLGGENGFEFIPSPGRRLGVHADTRFELKTMDLPQSGRLFVYTDGLLENQGLSGKTLTQRKLRSLLGDSRGTSPSAVSRMIHDAIESLWGKEGDRDDTTFLVVDWAG
ncbi:MAG: PP2C family protein-serine/threonine phosphatase [Silvanigrellaceae bacterium]